MVTREECLNALERLYSLKDGIFNKYYLEEDVMSLILKDKRTVDTLIKEYFEEKSKENPPLKFEDLKEDDWIWDNFAKGYWNIHSIDEEERQIEVKPFYRITFEENRFFKYQIEEK